MKSIFLLLLSLTVVYGLAAAPAYCNTSGIIKLQTSGEPCPDNPFGQIIAETSPGSGVNDFFQTIFDDFSLEGNQEDSAVRTGCRLRLTIMPTKGKKTLHLELEGFIEIPEDQRVVIKIKSRQGHYRSKQVFRYNESTFDDINLSSAIKLHRCSQKPLIITISVKIKGRKGLPADGLVFIDQIRGLLQ